MENNISEYNLEQLNADQAEAELCRQSLYEFLVSFWEVVNTTTLKDTPFIKAICDEIQEAAERVIKREKKLYDIILNVPPGSGKTNIICQMLPVWVWIKNPKIKSISTSYSERASSTPTKRSRDIIESPKFQRLFPGLIEFKKDSNNINLYENTQGGARITTSVGGTITSMHADLILIDDPQDPERAASKIERDRTNDWLDQTLSTRKIDKDVTLTILVQQRLNEMDATANMLSKGENIKHINLPAELSKDVKPESFRGIYTDGLLDPVRMSREILEAEKLKMGSLSYATQYEQRPYPEGGSIIKKDWFGFITPDEYKRNYGSKTKNGYYDTAYTSNKKNDPSAMMSAAIINGCLYINEVVEQWLEFPDLLAYIHKFTERNEHTFGSRQWIEPKASGKSIVQSLKEGKLNVIEFESPKDDKETRVASITAFLEAKKCIIVGNPFDSWVDKFIEQCCQFPNGQHDDMVDCLVMACTEAKTLSKGRTKFTFHSMQLTGKDKIIQDIKNQLRTNNEYR